MTKLEELKAAYDNAAAEAADDAWAAYLADAAADAAYDVAYKAADAAYAAYKAELKKTKENSND